jgi:hypothetical protein
LQFLVQPAERVWQPGGPYGLRMLPVRDADSALLLALLLSGPLQLHRLRLCGQCRRWFFARRSLQRFCSGNCRKRSSEAREPVELRREHRAEYMRSYRETLRQNPTLIVRQNRRKEGDRQ